MRIKMILLTASACVAVVFLSAAQAQTIRVPAKSVPPGVRERLHIDPARLSTRFTGGSTYWISPVLSNAAGTISGERFTVDGKVITARFGFSVVNPGSGRVAHVRMRCFDKSGTVLSRYSQSFTIAGMGAAIWHSDRVSPRTSTDHASQDADSVWCLISADIPVMAFGWTRQSYGSRDTFSNFSLVPVQPEHS